MSELDRFTQKCDSCGKKIINGLVIQTEYYTRVFCKYCLKKAVETLKMKMNKTQEEKNLIKSIRRYLRHA